MAARWPQEAKKEPKWSQSRIREASKAKLLIFEKQSFNEDLILKIYNKIKNFQFFEHEKKLLKYLNLENENIIKYSYLFDRLSFDDKLTTSVFNKFCSKKTLSNLILK